MKVSFVCANSEDELQSALDLAKRVFQAPAMQDSDTYKELLWKSDPSFRPENVFLAKSDGKVIGVIRAVTRDFLFSHAGHELVVPAACLSSVCIEPESRGKGISNGLNEFAIRLLTDQGIRVAYLIARKAVDGYYNKFEFQGVSLYETVSLRSPHELSRLRASRIVLREGTHESDLNVIQNAYSSSYRNCIGNTIRDSRHWNHLFMRLDRMRAPRFSCLFNGQECVGYVVANDEQVLEAGLVDESLGKEVVTAVFESWGITSFAIPHRHTLVHSLSGLDIQFGRRTCSYGGHMVRILSDTLASEVRRTLRLRELSRDEYARLTPAAAVCYALGSEWPQNPEMDAHGGFNLSFPDQL